RRGDEVLQHLDVVRVDGLGLDAHLAHLERAAHDHGDHAAAGAGLDGLVGELLLCLGHLALHLLDLLHHLLVLGVHDGGAPYWSSGSCSASKVSSAMRIIAVKSISWGG